MQRFHSQLYLPPFFTWSAPEWLTHSLPTESPYFTITKAAFATAMT